MAKGKKFLTQFAPVYEHVELKYVDWSDAVVWE
jgi:hypothetical protein